MSDFDDLLESCAGTDDSRFHAASLLADAWGPALVASYQLGRADGYTAGRWDAEAEMAQAWKAAADQVRNVLARPTFAELKRRRGAA